MYLAQLISDKPQLRSIANDPLAGRKSTVGGVDSVPVEIMEDEEEVFKDADKEETQVAKDTREHLQPIVKRARKTFV